MSRSRAIVLAGHGSQRHPATAAPLRAHADRIRAGGRFDEVRTAFWKEEPTLREVPIVVSSEIAYVVPVLTSEGYFANEVFPRELGVGRSDRSTGAGAPVDGVDLRYAEPVGTHGAMRNVIEDRVRSSIDGSAQSVGVAVVGHGTERNERSALATLHHVDRLRDEGRYADVVALFLDQEPYVGDLVEHLDAEEIVVVPFFVADGYHTTQDIPDAIGHPGIGETARIDGQLVHYSGAVGTEPRLADVIVERAFEVGASRRAQPARGASRSPVDESFRWWVEAVDGGREWGQLSIRATGDGYELRHRTDVRADRDELLGLDDVSALSEHVRYDERGQYRPLSGARSLPTGWRYRASDPDDLTRAVRSVYPASIDHWHDRLTGTFDATRVRQQVARQTGIYADLDDLDREELAAARAAVCGDCVRHPHWAADEDGPIATIDDGGGEADGSIPCREACPFFLSAAHAFVDGDPHRPADAAPDPTVQVGALEEPGNRYRVRFAEARTGQADQDSAAPRAGGDR